MSLNMSFQGILKDKKNNNNKKPLFEEIEQTLETNIAGMSKLLDKKFKNKMINLLRDSMKKLDNMQK